MDRQARAIDLQDRLQDLGLKKGYAKWVLRAMGAQMIVADAVFIMYAWVGVDWKVDPVVMQAWLAATVVQITGFPA